MLSIIIGILGFGAYLFVMWSNFWCKIPYEGTEDEIIIKTWGGDNDDKYTNKYVPMYKNYWGKIYYGEFSINPFSKKWVRNEYSGGFGGDASLFTQRRIKNHYLYHDSWIGKQILKEQQHTRTAENQLNEGEGNGFHKS